MSVRRLRVDVRRPRAARMVVRFSNGCASPKLHPSREIQVFTVRVCLTPVMSGQDSIWVEIESGS
jgi:hypothetical protein